MNQRCSSLDRTRPWDFLVARPRLRSVLSASESDKQPTGFETFLALQKIVNARQLGEKLRDAHTAEKETEIREIRRKFSDTQGF